MDKGYTAREIPRAVPLESMELQSTMEAIPESALEEVAQVPALPPNVLTAAVPAPESE